MEETGATEGPRTRQTFPSGSNQVAGFLSTVPLLFCNQCFTVLCSHWAFTVSRYVIHFILHFTKHVVSTICDDHCLSKGSQWLKPYNSTLNKDSSLFLVLWLDHYTTLSHKLSSWCPKACLNSWRCHSETTRKSWSGANLCWEKRQLLLSSFFSRLFCPLCSKRKMNLGSKEKGRGQCEPQKVGNPCWLGGTPRRLPFYSCQATSVNRTGSWPLTTVPIR